MSELVEKAEAMARAAHAGLRDRQGSPAIEHVMRVSRLGATEDERIVGALHDALEDADLTISRVRRAGFSDEIASALDAITRRPGEFYFDYIERVARNPLAARVKLYDLADNIRRGRGDSRFVSLIERYKRAAARLSAAACDRGTTGATE